MFRRSDGRFEIPPGGLFLGWVYISFQFSLADIPSRTFPPSGRPSERRNHIFLSCPAAGGGSRHIGRAPGPHIPPVCKDAGRTACGTAVRPPQGRENKQHYAANACGRLQ